MAKKTDKHKKKGTGFPRATLVRVAQDLNDALGLEPEINVTRPDSLILKGIKEAIEYVDPEVDELTEETWGLIAKLEGGAVRGTGEGEVVEKEVEVEEPEKGKQKKEPEEQRSKETGVDSVTTIQLGVEAYNKIPEGAVFSKKQLTEGLVLLAKENGRVLSFDSAYYTIGWVLATLKALNLVYKKDRLNWVKGRANG